MVDRRVECLEGDEALLTDGESGRSGPAHRTWWVSNDTHNSMDPTVYFGMTEAGSHGGNPMLVPTILGRHTTIELIFQLIAPQQ